MRAEPRWDIGRAASWFAIATSITLVAALGCRSEPPTRSAQLADGSARCMTYDGVSYVDGWPIDPQSCYPLITDLDGLSRPAFPEEATFGANFNSGFACTDQDTWTACIPTPGYCVDGDVTVPEGSCSPLGRRCYPGSQLSPTEDCVPCVRSAVWSQYFDEHGATDGLLPYNDGDCFPMQSDGSGFVCLGGGTTTTPCVVSCQGSTASYAFGDCIPAAPGDDVDPTLCTGSSVEPVPCENPRDAVCSYDSAPVTDGTCLPLSGQDQGATCQNGEADETQPCGASWTDSYTDSGDQPGSELAPCTVHGTVYADPSCVPDIAGQTAGHLCHSGRVDPNMPCNTTDPP